MAGSLLVGAAGLVTLGQVTAPVSRQVRTGPPTTLDLGDIRIHAIRTGRVAVKRAHRVLAGPDVTRFGSIVLDPRWTDWLPVTCFLVEHPETTVMIDAGETARTAEPGYFDCDLGTRLVYDRLLRFDVHSDDESGPQLDRLGVDPANVDIVAMTHLHGDHTGGLHHFPNARFLASRTELERPTVGALRCRWPDFFTPSPVDYDDGPFGAFPKSRALTEDKAVRLVPTPGHTYGHQSVLIRGAEDGAERWVLVGGDATFDLQQVRSRTVAGICDDPTAARKTVAHIADQLAAYPTVYAPAHDPHGAERLADSGTAES
ncbi:N-acyl homoserine lactonase family protein [Halomarina ordinaria]|uniref:N-acyl homoserine lactonase family protein n=1 Tax=Halomarina ordinaria TaxID=3033939 RepID=A0ABD5U8M8_9EURY|nr:N-acyl homoserine lactonase family protein [Halomarina sp. PSRA2]